MIPAFVSLSVCLLLLSSSAPLLVLSSDPCDAASQPDRRTLRPDQITVLINGYSEFRIPLLQLIAVKYSASPLVSSVVVLWGNPTTSAQILGQLAQNLTSSSFSPATISLVRQPSNSLNSRFLPLPSINTHAVLIIDDDVEVDVKSFEFAFRIWRSNPHRLIGLFVRSHDIDLSAKKWMYTVHPDRYSIVLTKFMILNREYLFEYSCNGGEAMRKMRKTVDKMQNCEDILMNIVVADKTNAAPILVGAQKVRDWGDARNDEGKSGLKGTEEEGNMVRKVGLSSRRSEHRKRRGECISHFHKILGRMPLRYGYGKVVNSVGEQGLCMKGGNLVFCDQQ
ncbi:Glycosyltransferase family protein 64 C3 [Linum perenne]